jgi:hypothetical protein
MLKLFASVAAALGFVAAADAFTGHYYSTMTLPAPAEAGRSEARVGIANDVIDGRLSLLEGAAAFHELNSRTPALAEVLPEIYKGDSDDERACRQVIAFVKVELESRQGDEGSVDTADAVLTRLNGELEAARGKDGKVLFSAKAE